MASDVGVKLNVSGVAQFKSAMNQAKGSVKQLDAELKLNAAQYKASGDAEEYMAGRSRILSQQIRAQEDVVSNCQKALEQMAAQGVDKASASYTNMAAQLAKAKTDLIQMQQSADGVGKELDQVAQSGDKAGDSLKSIDKGVKWQNITTALDKVDRLLENMFKKAINIGKAIANWERGSSDWADELMTNAAMYGMDVETLQRYEYAAQLIDTSVDTIVKANDKLMSKSRTTDGIMAMLETGNTQYAVRVRESNGALRDQTDVFWDFLDVLKQVENETDRNALAQEYFGKSYRELIPLINAGRKRWEEAANEAPIVSEEDVTALGELNDAYVKFDAQLQQLSNTLASELSPAMKQVLEAMGVVSDSFMTWLKSDEGKAAIERLGTAVADLITGMADKDWSAMFDGAKAAVNSIADFLEGIKGGDLLDGIAAVGAGIAAWKISKELAEAILFIKMFNGGNGGTNGAGVNSGTNGSSNSVPPITNANPSNGVQYMDQASGFFSKLATTWLGAKVMKEFLEPEIIDLTNDQEFQQRQQEYHQAIYEKIFAPEGTSPDEYYAKYGYLPVASEAAAAKNTTPTVSLWENISDFFSAHYEEKAAEAAEMFTEEFYQGVKDSVKAARMYRNYADILDEVGEGAQLDRLMANHYVDLYNARQMAEDLHNGYEIPPEVLEYANMALFDRVRREMFPEDFESSFNFGEQLIEAANAAGMDASGAFGEGAMANVDAAFAAGAALGAAFASGAASAGGGGSGDTNYNSSYVGAVNVYGAQSPREIADAYRGYILTQQAGYGG